MAILSILRVKSRRYSRALLDGIDRMPLRRLLGSAAGLVVLFAGSYWFLTGRGTGQGITQVSGKCGFVDALYFSVVTFTSLGYGDIVPQGYSRLIACAEVVLGLAVLGLAIAKLSSSKQSYLLAQLYARDAQERLEGYVNQLRNIRPIYKDAIELLKKGQWPTPSLKSRHSEVHRIVLRAKAYVGFEVNNSNFLQDVPSGAISKLFNTMAQVVVLVGQSAGIPRSQHSQSQRMVAVNVVREMKGFLAIVEDKTEDPAIRSTVHKLSERCDSLEVELLTTLHEVAVQTQSVLPKRFIRSGTS